MDSDRGGPEGPAVYMQVVRQGLSEEVNRGQKRSRQERPAGESGCTVNNEHEERQGK